MVINVHELDRIKTTLPQPEMYTIGVFETEKSIVYLPKSESFLVSLNEKATIKIHIGNGIKVTSNATIQDLLDGFATVQDLINNFTTVQDLLDYVVTR